MKKYIVSVVLAFVLLFSYQVTNASFFGDVFHNIFGGKSAVVAPSNLGASASTAVTLANTPTTDLTPRISYWQGKVNQHVDIASGTWQTDIDGSSGAGIDKLVYCKKFYPNTIGVATDKTETINSWYNAGNTNMYVGSNMSYSCISSTSTTDATPRVSFWQGKVNQHVDVASGTWQTDLDGSSGSEIDKLAYCQKFYPNTTSAIAYKTETLNSWYSAGNRNIYTGSQMSYKCSTETVTPSITVLSPNGGESYVAGQQVTVKWRSQNIPASTEMFIVLNGNDGHAFDLSVEVNNNSNSLNDGSEIITIPTIDTWHGMQFGTKYKISVQAYPLDKGAIDFSDNSFTINPTTSACSLSATVVDTYLSTDKTEWGFHININAKNKPANSNGWLTNFQGYTPTVTAYGVNQIFGNFFTSSGQPLSFTATDQVDSNCKVTTTITPPTTTTPSITVLSPNGGETYTAGQQVTVRWKSENAPAGQHIGITLEHLQMNGVTQAPSDANGSPVTGLVSDTSGQVLVSAGSAVVTLPRFTQTIGSNYYRITVFWWNTQTSTGQNDRSDNYFTIIPSTTPNLPTPTITSLYPANGSQLIPGQNINIKWLQDDFKDYSNNNYLKIFIKHDNYIIKELSVLNDGQETITIPSNTSEGEYKIFLSYNNGNNNYNFASYYVKSSINSSTTDNGCSNGNIYSSTTGQLCNSVTLDTTPRIAYWSGKVNQHVDAQGNWQTDPDGVSGAKLDKLKYCKKFYPNTTSVIAYKTEAINSWHDVGNRNNYTGTNMSYKCVIPAPSITSFSPTSSIKIGTVVTILGNNFSSNSKVDLRGPAYDSLIPVSYLSSAKITFTVPNDVNNGTYNYDLSVTGEGNLISSNTSISITGGSTIASCSLNSPTLISSSSFSGQYVATGDTGVTDATKATYKFSNSGCGTETISELKFSATNATSVKVSGISAPVVNGVAYITDLNLAVPNGGSGLNVDAYVSYPNVGITGLPSGSTSQIALTYVKYASNGISTSTTLTSPVSAPTMMLVNSKPTITVSTPSGAIIQSYSNVEAIDVTVTADTHGYIKFNSLPILLSAQNAILSGSSSFPITVKDSNGNPITTTNTSFASGSSVNSVISFSNGYVIGAGQSQTFKIYVNVASVGGTTGRPGTASLVAQLGNISNLSWSDSTSKTMTGSNNTTYFYNYPATTSFINN